MATRDCPCFQLGLAHKRVVRAFEEALAPLGLTIAQAHFLSCLYQQDAMLAKDLARELAVDAGTLTPMIDRLERQGLIRRCPDPSDRRATRLCLEPAGRRLQDDVEARCMGVKDGLESRVSPEALAQCLLVLKTLTENALNLEGLPWAVSSALLVTKEASL
jgi:DNA-binding MarR family transcriptional regulator